MKAKQDKGRHCRINATVTEEERAALDRLVKTSDFASVSTLIGALALAVDRVTTVGAPDSIDVDELSARVVHRY